MMSVQVPAWHTKADAYVIEALKVHSQTASMAPDSKHAATGNISGTWVQLLLMSTTLH